MTEATENKEPCGVVAIWVTPEGVVTATAADFDRSGYGGFKTWEAQRLRCRNAVFRRMIEAYCSPVVGDAITSHIADQIAREMLSSGHKIVLRTVGYDDDIRNAIERG